MQLALFASIFAACIMYFWPFMRSLESGMMSAHTATFTSQYPLTRYYKSKSDKGQSSRATASSDGRSRRDYIEIRTDIAVIPGGQPKAPCLLQKYTIGTRLSQERTLKRLDVDGSIITQNVTGYCTVMRRDSVERHGVFICPYSHPSLRYSGTLITLCRRGPPPFRMMHSPRKSNHISEGDVSHGVISYK